MKRLGVIVNPIAGIGGRVGLKGSDGLDVQRRARDLGGEPLAQDRTAAALTILRQLAPEVDVLTPPGEMGESATRRCGFALRLIPTSGRPAGASSGTTAEDTRQAAQALRDIGVDLILFAGGDGTARDVYEAIGTGVPVLGIPAGVKIHSAVFGVTPGSSGELAAEYLKGGRARLREAEVVDLDEAAYQQGQIVTRLYGYLSVPYRREYVQNQKVPTPASEAAQARSIAADVVERMVEGRGYLLGPGTTTRAIAERLGLPKTLVGVDILTRSEALALDVGERQILEMLARRPLHVIITPTGGQGFLLGRGNQQLSPEVIRRVGRASILVVSLATKIAALEGRPLLVDTGDPEVDSMLSGYVEVVTGFRESTIYRVTGGR